MPGFLKSLGLAPRRSSALRIRRRGGATVPRLEGLEPRTLLASFEGLGFYEGATSSTAVDVSDDGTAVAITSGSYVFRWTEEDGLEPFFFPNGNPLQGSVAAISGDGSTIVGSYSESAAAIRAFRARGGGAQPLGGFEQGGVANITYAFDVSADGSIVVGQHGPFPTELDAYKWQGGAVTILVEGANAAAVSADGSSIAGTVAVPGGPFGALNRAFRWDGGAITVMPTSDTSISGATDISPDGSVVIGTQRTGFFDTVGFRWTEDGLVHIIPEDDSIAAGPLTPLGVSQDGAVIVGTTNYGTEAFIWNEGNNLSRRLYDVLKEAGLESELAGWRLREAVAVTPDGLTIVGNGLNPQGRLEAWIAKLDPPLLPPDIEIESAILQNKNIIYNYKVDNYSGDFIVALYQSDDDILDDSDTFVTADVLSTLFSPNGSGSFSTANLTNFKMYLLIAADPASAAMPQGQIHENDENNNIKSVLTTDIRILSFIENMGGGLQSNGNLEVKYEIEGASIPPSYAPMISVYWASGNQTNNIISKIDKLTKPIEKSNGAHYFIIDISELNNPPEGATHLLAVIDEPQTVPETVTSNNIISFRNLDPQNISLELKGTFSGAPDAPTRYERVRRWLIIHANAINRTAAKYNIDRRAIAGAIAWEALQNVTNNFASTGVRGPGKVKPFALPNDPESQSAAAFVEGNARYQPLLPEQSIPTRILILRTPLGSISYIAAIMNAYATEAELAGYTGENGIRNRPDILATYYNGVRGFELENAQAAFAQRPRDEFKAGETMGQWVKNNLNFIESSFQ